ncbi:S-adenosyl-L-methionine-dependent methyltransferase [Mycena venus]|uniref:S-adenosyl-L-methionine-dependent methyltransferase n=1 Tax=Mycena venus TaxID=2733690 RepID=A0A8H6WWZ4_9AGAR|nr:S-adenosyl-L-methionine-dependent methyltransferase [Mycena venus]
MSTKELSRVDYWDERYRDPDSRSSKEDGTFEWFKSYSNLEPLFEECLPPPSPSSPRILHLGCGNSNLPIDLHTRGYKNQVCVDFSEVVIRDMGARFEDREGIEWVVADVRDMNSVEDGAFDVAIDKGTLDAMLWGSLWDPPDEVKENVRRYIDEVTRTLKPGGTFLYITYRQPRFMKPFLIRDLWDLQVRELKEEAGAFEYFAFVMKKKTT